MTSAVGWYGPLIDLAKAALHVGHFVQLLVFVHRSTPVQYKSWKGGEVVRRDIQVGDDSRPYFPISIWQKQIGSMALPGHIILLQNVKITKYGQVLEARTVHCSSLLPLIIHPCQSLVSRGMDELVAECRIGIVAKEKLKKVIEWLQRAGSTTFCSNQPHCHPSAQKMHFERNWKLPEERKSKDCVSLSDLSRLTDSCKAVFLASVGEIFLPFTTKILDASEKEKMFVSGRLSKAGDTSLATDLICTGCQICGSPLEMQHGSTFEKEAAPLYCSESSNHLHVVSFIYRPFMLYVWDESEYVPLLVRNKAAELLFGNIKAERVYSSFREQRNDQDAGPKDSTQRDPRGVFKDFSCSSAVDTSLKLKGKQRPIHNINFFVIWLILLKSLLQQGKNSPLKFEVIVNTGLDRENGRFEMVSVWMPCF
ncbi:hypothetical protein PanWU01x14_157220 [Parasponia andersonii]|uniref:Nucleic acid-binding, OB-fold containing protein n=1 Tax=Parasponia andersonii TaxID=3476 RepID=A0A2P5CFL7_PARAD|nr:hypothetical protein PanWU01x14_157220 [Parasponia andersonii]